VRDSVHAMQHNNLVHSKSRIKPALNPAQFAVVRFASIVTKAMRASSRNNSSLQPRESVWKIYLWTLIGTGLK